MAWNATFWASQCILVGIERIMETGQVVLGYFQSKCKGNEWYKSYVLDASI